MSCKNSAAESLKMWFARGAIKLSCKEKHPQLQYFLFLQLFYGLRWARTGNLKAGGSSEELNCIFSNLAQSCPAYVIKVFPGIRSLSSFFVRLCEECFLYLDSGSQNQGHKDCHCGPNMSKKTLIRTEI